MSIKDRGIVKWRAASFLPEQGELLRELDRDLSRMNKPELDEYQVAEFEERIHYAMEFAHFVSLDVWDDGFVSPVVGRVCRLDAVGKRLCIEGEDGAMDCVRWADVIGVSVLD